MLFDRNAVKVPGSLVAMLLRLKLMRGERLAIRRPHIQQFPFGLLRDGCAGESLAPRVGDPETFRMPELSPEEEAGSPTTHGIGCSLDVHGRLRSRPGLILELTPIDADRIIE